MAISKVCGEFETIWKFFPDELKDSGEYDFKNASLNAYCPNGDSENNKECKTDVDKINAGSLWLFNKFYGDSNKFSNYADGKIDVVVYFMMWLGYKLNQKTHDGINTFNDFYTRNINNNEKYTNTIDGVEGYNSYKDLIDKKKEFMDISNENMSNLYDVFKMLCNMINNAKKNDNDETYLKYANNFVNKHNELKNDSNNIQGNSYNKILSTLSNDYTSFKNTYYDSNIRSKLPSLIMEKKTQISLRPNGSQDMFSSETLPSSTEIEVSISETDVSDSEKTLSSSLTISKIIPIPFILVATIILLGISYKYSLFGFWKRLQRQYLREKLKKRRK
ncbi:BIR protein [Plasmodium berghei ANKA]|uniref:BIR protein n=1 Tax=Plasmodium berghei (strain Anka) TaxID=5823 RepID=A0A509AHG1_PLABA|nr:BIR protein [Plasmodium berghei ANKA]VUC54664.1 BIR protein [Plasmodium berghei ANKA]|eukprot:XP_034420491.1 BIR protein [Plasmodium berghei ANKA]